MRIASCILTGTLMAILVSGCATTYSSGHRPPPKPPVKKQGARGLALHVPPGHLPPPGSCRIWVPGVPPGQQAAPGRCDRLASTVPPGALLLVRSRDVPEHVEVFEYHAVRPGVVVQAAVYLAATGEFVGSRAAR